MTQSGASVARSAAAMEIGLLTGRVTAAGKSITALYGAAHPASLSTNGANRAIALRRLRSTAAARWNRRIAASRRSSAESWPPSTHTSPTRTHQGWDYAGTLNT